MNAEEYQLFQTRFQENEEAAAALMSSFSDDDLNWQPDGGKAWSVAQCVEHLAVSNEQYLAEMQPAVKGAPANSSQALCSPGWFGRFFVSLLEPPAKMRVTAPKKILPAARLSVAGTMAHFRESHRQIENLLAELKDRDPNAIIFRNPLMPGLRLKAGTGLLILAAHERRHLWQAKNVSERIRSRL